MRVLIPILLFLELLPSGGTFAQTPGVGDPLRPAWKLRLEEFSGNAHRMISGGGFVFFDDFYGIAQVDLAKGKRLRRLKKRDQQGCEDETVDLQTAAGMLYALTVCYPSEEEAARPGQGPRLSRQSTLRAFALRNGRLRWRFEGRIPEPVALDGGKLFLLADGFLLALEGRSGKKLWQTSVAGEFFVGPAAAGGRVFLQQEEGEALAFDAASGTKLWAKQVPGRSRCFTAADGKHLILARLLGEPGDSTSSWIACLSAESGELRWEKTLPGQLAFHRPVLSEGTVYLVTSGEKTTGVVSAWEAGSGREIWKREVVCDHDCAPVPWKGWLLVWSADLDEFHRNLVSNRYSLLFLDAASGAQLGSHLLKAGEKFALSRPVAAKGRLVYSIGDVVKGFSFLEDRLRRLHPKKPGAGD